MTVGDDDLQNGGKTNLGQYTGGFRSSEKGWRGMIGMRFISFQSGPNLQTKTKINGYKNRPELYLLFGSAQRSRNQNQGRVSKAHSYKMCGTKR